MTSTYRQMVNVGLLTAMAVFGIGCSDSKTDPPSNGGGGSGGSSATGGSGGGSNGGSGGSVTGPCVTDGNIVITDDTNYTFKFTLTIQSTTVKDKTDLTFDWSAVTKDFLGLTLDPVKDIDLVVVSAWGMTEQEITDNLNKDKLPLNSNKGALTAYPGEETDFTSVKLTELSSFHNEVPEDVLWSYFDTSTENYQYPQDKNTFMMIVASGTTPGKDSRMLGFFKLDPASTNNTVALTNDSTKMEWEAHLANIKPIFVPANQASLSIDWKNMTVNAIGNPYDVSQITEAVVAHYATLTLEDLEQQFLYLEDEADGWWSGEVISGTTMDLSTLKDEGGAAFPGIDSNGVWLVALFCTSSQCNNPAPWSITVLKPCG